MSLYSSKMAIQLSSATPFRNILNDPGIERSKIVDPKGLASMMPPSKMVPHLGHNSLKSSIFRLFAAPLTFALVNARAPPNAWHRLTMNLLSGILIPAILLIFQANLSLLFLLQSTMYAMSLSKAESSYSVCIRRHQDLQAK